jgi:hypothetical protein
MNNYIMPHALSDIKSLHVTYYAWLMADMIRHMVYELLMSILILIQTLIN